MTEKLELPAGVDKALDGLEEFLNKVLDATGLDLGFDIDACDPDKPVDVEAPDIVVEFSGPDTDLLFEERAELLRSLEYLGHRWVRLEPSQTARIRFDAEGADLYRERRRMGPQVEALFCDLSRFEQLIDEGRRACSKQMSVGALNFGAQVGDWAADDCRSARVDLPEFVTHPDDPARGVDRDHEWMSARQAWT